MIGRFTIEEGRTRSVAFSLNHDCLTENHISLKSEQKFFQLREPTDAIVFRPDLNYFFAKIDATKLKQGVYHIKVQIQLP
jgi:hypothetical protein